MKSLKSVSYQVFFSSARAARRKVSRKTAKDMLDNWAHTNSPFLSGSLGVYGGFVAVRKDLLKHSVGMVGCERR